MRNKVLRPALPRRKYPTQQVVADRGIDTVATSVLSFPYGAHSAATAISDPALDKSGRRARCTAKRSSRESEAPATTERGAAGSRDRGILAIHLFAPTPTQPAEDQGAVPMDFPHGHPLRVEVKVDPGWYVFIMTYLAAIWSGHTIQGPESAYEMIERRAAPTWGYGERGKNVTGW